MQVTLRRGAHWGMSKGQEHGNVNVAVGTGPHCSCHTDRPLGMGLWRRSHGSGGLRQPQLCYYKPRPHSHIHAHKYLSLAFHPSSAKRSQKMSSKATSRQKIAVAGAKQSRGSSHPGPFQPPAEQPQSAGWQLGSGRRPLSFESWLLCSLLPTTCLSDAVFT